MPLYAYRCTECGYLFEKIQRFSAKPESECPKCKGKLERPLTAPGLSFKGKGFYVNDYAPKSGGSDSAPPAESAPAKPACDGACASCPAAAAATNS